MELNKSILYRMGWTNNWFTSNVFTFEKDNIIYELNVQDSTIKKVGGKKRKVDTNVKLFKLLLKEKLYNKEFSRKLKLFKLNKDGI